MCSFPSAHIPSSLNKPSLACVCFNLSCVLASRRSSNASEKKRAKSSARSKSPFRSFRFKKKEKEKETGSGHYSDDEENYDRTIGKIRREVAADFFWWWWTILGIQSACPFYVVQYLTSPLISSHYYIVLLGSLAIFFVLVLIDHRGLSPRIGRW